MGETEKKTQREKENNEMEQVSAKVNDGRNRSRSLFKFVSPW